MVAAVLGSRGVVTDSGGLQKEAFLLRGRARRCAPRPSGSRRVEGGWNVLAEPDRIVPAVTPSGAAADRAAPYGDGTAAAAAVRHWRQAFPAAEPRQDGPGVVVRSRCRPVTRRGLRHRQAPWVMRPLSRRR